MRTLAVTQDITLDGAVEMLDDRFDPQGSADASDRQAANRALSAGPGTRGATLKAAPGRDTVATGSISLCHTLFRADLIDQVNL